MPSSSTGLFAYDRRQEGRVSLPSDSAATVRFTSLDGGVSVRTVRDVSVGGFAFEALAEDIRLSQGHTLEGVRLDLPGLTVTIPDVAVRFVGASRVGVSADRLADDDAEKLLVVLAAMGPVPVELDGRERFDDVVSFHRRMRLLPVEMDACLTARFSEARRAWERVHRQPEALMRTAFLPWGDGPGETLSCARAYENTWLLQHSAVASPAMGAGSGGLHTMLMRLAARRPDTHYVAGFVDAGSRAPRGLLRSFFTGPALGRDRGAAAFPLYCAPAATNRPVSEARLRRLRDDDEAVVEAVASRTFDPVTARALGLRTGEVELPRTRQAYRRIRLDRGREAWGAFERGDCTAVLLRESASPGLSLTGLLSAGMLLPMATALDPDGSRRRALCELMRQGAPDGAPYRFLWVPVGADDAPVQAAGFGRMGDWMFLSIHRLGLSAYQRYVATRSGLLSTRPRRTKARA